MASLPSFAANLKRHREGLGMRPSDLARSVGVSPSTILRYEEEGGRLPPGALLVALSEVLGVTPKTLLGSDARALPESRESPRVGRPPGKKEALAVDMLATLRSPPKETPPEVPRPSPTPARRTKHEPE